MDVMATAMPFLSMIDEWLWCACCQLVVGAANEVGTYGSVVDGHVVDGLVVLGRVRVSVGDVGEDHLCVGFRRDAVDGL